MLVKVVLYVCEVCYREDAANGCALCVCVCVCVCEREREREICWLQGKIVRYVCYDVIMQDWATSKCAV